MSRANAIDKPNDATLWASSAKGQEAIDQAMQRAQATTETLDEARKVDFEVIRRPLGMRL